MISGRALHYVLKIGNRSKNAFFFRNILGMKVLRHEEFTEGCDAQCNGPYDNRWSKTMIGYGSENTHFVIELTYNYGVKSYELGNDLGNIKIRSNDIIERAKQNNYPIVEENNLQILTSPDGYKFVIVNEIAGDKKCLDPVESVTLHCTNLKNSIDYWNKILHMNILCQNDYSCLLSYGDDQAKLELKLLDQPLNRAKAYGRIAFAVPYDIQPKIDEIIKESNHKILTPLILLDTMDKPTVRVIILADPDDHEICFVDEESFTKLSEFDPNGNDSLDKYIKKDPFE